MENVIQVESLTHRFGNIVAVNDFSFDVKKGEVLALLGPNGAGKTTTIRLLNGLFNRSGGRIQVLGLDPGVDGQKIREQTGVLTETPGLYERLTAWQNLEFFGTLAGMPEVDWQARAREFLEFFDLTGRADDRVATYSKGMKQRLALARALLHSPALLFLDEPTAGLDPEASLQVHELIKSIRQRSGQTVMLCTHNLVEAERLCDRMVIMNRGVMLAIGGLNDLRRMHSSGVWVNVELLEPMPGILPARLEEIEAVLSIEIQNSRSFKAQVQDKTLIPELAASLIGLDAQLLALKPQEVSLEDIYFDLQGQHRGGVE
jgi:ABC-2 type transport system ATP-binding protein